MGEIYAELNRNDEAVRYFEKSLDKFKQVNRTAGIAHVLNNIGKIFLKQKNYSKAVSYFQKSLDIALTTSARVTKNTTWSLYQCYKIIGKYDEALKTYELYIATRDSLQSEENQKEIIRQQYKYQYEKQAGKDSVANAKQQEIKNAEIARHKAEIRAKKNQQYLLFGGLALVVIFAGFMYNRFRVISRQKKEIEKQKTLVDEKQKEILDSIHYAKRIQRALLPNEKYIGKAINKKLF